MHSVQTESFQHTHPSGQELIQVLVMKSSLYPSMQVSHFVVTFLKGSLQARQIPGFNFLYTGPTGFLSFLFFFLELPSSSSSAVASSSLVALVLDAVLLDVFLLVLAEVKEFLAVVFLELLATFFLLVAAPLVEVFFLAVAAVASSLSSSSSSLLPVPAVTFLSSFSVSSLSSSSSLATGFFAGDLAGVLAGVFAGVFEEGLVLLLALAFPELFAFADALAFSFDAFFAFVVLLVVLFVLVFLPGVFFEEVSSESSSSSVVLVLLVFPLGLTVVFVVSLAFFFGLRSSSSRMHLHWRGQGNGQHICEVKLQPKPFWHIAQLTIRSLLGSIQLEHMPACSSHLQRLGHTPGLSSIHLPAMILYSQPGIQPMQFVVISLNGSQQLVQTPVVAPLHLHVGGQGFIWYQALLKVSRATIRATVYTYFIYRLVKNYKRSSRHSEFKNINQAIKQTELDYCIEETFFQYTQRSQNISSFYFFFVIFQQAQYFFIEQFFYIYEFLGAYQKIIEIKLILSSNSIQSFLDNYKEFFKYQL